MEIKVLQVKKVKMERKALKDQEVIEENKVKMVKKE